MRNRILLLLIFLHLLVQSQAQTSPELRTAIGHPMKYYISLPGGFTKSKQWPVVFVLEAAEKEFRKNAARFVEARGEMPFIIVAPVNTNNGNQGRKDPSIFPYSKETWDYIDKVGDCQFNLDGIRQIMIDVKNEFNGEDKIYITGFEAGAHDMWSVVFNHPEYLKAAASVAGNFRNRCISSLSVLPEQQRTLPIKSIGGSKDEFMNPAGVFYSQWLEAKKLALSQGFTNVSETIIEGQGHAPMPKQVLEYFYSLK